MEMSKVAQNVQASGVRRMFEMASQYENVVNFAIGEPGFTTPEHISKVAMDYLLQGRTKYAPNAGVPELRQAVARKLKRENNITCDPDKNLVITFGAVEALHLTMMATVNPGDEVIVPCPAWPDYYGQIEMAHAVPVRAMLTEKNQFKMTADVIRPLLSDKTRLVIINSPHNPTGAVLSKEELQGIVDLLAGRNLFVLSDEPYEHIIYDGAKHISIGSLGGLEDQLVTVNTMSKTYAMTGWRVGFACGPEKLIADLIKMHEVVGSCVNEALQLGAAYAYDNGDADIRRMVAHYDANRKLVVEGLNRLKGITCMMPKGAFYAFPNITGLHKTSEQVAEDLIRDIQVITAPGTAFGPAGEGYLRLSYANDRASIVEALKRMEAYFGLK